jgi:hypothetical protein
MAFTVSDGFFVSSIRYKVFIEGRAINSKRIAGRMVQTVSISCPSIMYLLNVFDTITDRTMYIVNTVIRIRTIMAWS